MTCLLVAIGGAARGVAIGMALRRQALRVRRNLHAVSRTASPFHWKELNS